MPEMDCVDLFFILAGSIIGIGDGLLLLLSLAWSAPLGNIIKDKAERKLPEGSTLDQEEDADSDFFSAMEGSSKPGTPRLKANELPRAFKHLSTPEKDHMPTMQDVDSLYELGGWMRGSSHGRRKAV